MVQNIGTISYAASSIAFLFLLLLLLTSWRGRLQGGVLVFATFTSVIWAALLALNASLIVGSLPVNIIEILRNAGWLSFLLMLLIQPRRQETEAIRPLIRLAVGVGSLCAGLLFITLYAYTDFAADHASLSFVLIMLGRVIISVIGIFLIHNLYRNAHPQHRWSIKFLCLSLGGMFAYDFYMYSDAMLFKHIDADIWTARGIINALIVPLLAVSAARNPTWSLNVSVSRQFLFHSATFVAAGLYMLAMAATGYYIRYFGGTWGRVLQATFLFGTLILLVLMLFSGTLRARFKVFVNKHFFSYKFDYREEWLRFTRTLSEGEPGIRLRERSIQAIAELIESPGGALWLNQESEIFKRAAHWNLPALVGDEPAHTAFCKFLETKQWVINLDDIEILLEKHPELDVPKWLTNSSQAWLVVPLILHEQLLGFVVLAHSRGKIGLNWEVSDLLKTAGRQAASYLAQLEAATALVVARQFESFNRMSAFVIHDLKNLVAQLSLLLKNAEKHQHNPEFQKDMLTTVEYSVEKIKRLLLQLRAGGKSVNQSTAINLSHLLIDVIRSKSNSKPKPQLVRDDDKLVMLAERERLERVIGHIVQNAIEATSANGSVLINLMAQDGFAIIEISDTGCGMSEQFMRESLFKPFESSKPTGMGIGMYESKEYVHELGGKIEVESKENSGTIFRVFLPLYLSVDQKHTEMVKEIQ